ncbi:MAG TPA: hypothetical protein VJH55_00195 [Candidatus Paceibacterota bacterium]
MSEITQGIPAPSRKKGWAKYQRTVAIIEVDKGEVVIWTGYICSTPMTHVGVDNVKRAVVYCDEIHNDLADDADDAHEIGMDVVSPNFIGADEIGLLQYPELRRLWFGDKYSDEMLAKIGEAVATVVFPKPEDDLDLRAFSELLQKG